MDLFEFFDQVEKSGVDVTKVLRTNACKITSIHDQFRAGCVEDFKELLSSMEGGEALCALRELIWQTGNSACEEGNVPVSFMSKLAWLGFLSGFQGALEQMVMQREEKV